MTTQDHPSGDRAALRPEPRAEQSLWTLLPRRNFRRALFLIAALVAIVFIKRMGGGLSLAKLFNDVAPPHAPTQTQSKIEPSFQHLEVKR